MWNTCGEQDSGVPFDDAELHRVYRYISNYTKRKLLLEYSQKIDRLRGKQIARKGQSSKSTTAIEDNSQTLTQEYFTVTELHENLQSELLEGDAMNHSTIAESDILLLLNDLQCQGSKKDVQEMIWEVDDDLDKKVSWMELRSMFQRGLSDRLGIEPCQLFYLVQFLIFDKDNTGSVTAEDILQMHFSRMGEFQNAITKKQIVTSDDNPRQLKTKFSINDYLDIVQSNIPTTRKFSPQGLRKM